MKRNQGPGREGDNPVVIELAQPITRLVMKNEQDAHLAMLVLGKAGVEVRAAEPVKQVEVVRLGRGWKRPYAASSSPSPRSSSPSSGPRGSKPSNS